ncbi:MAG: class I SAM-dependent methyltransferase [bacterium]
MNTALITDLLDGAIAARQELMESRHESAFRLFNGFSEGCPTLVIDIYGSTALLNDYTELAAAPVSLIQTVCHHLKTRLPWIRVILLKTRNGKTEAEKRGVILSGTGCNRRVKEHGLWYAVDLCLNRDASLYLDTRNLRQWATRSLKGKTVLNTFAYTGSLGVAALAGGAARVVQLDLNREFMNLAEESYALNHLPNIKANIRTGDFWPEVNQMKREGERFDCVFLDPPIFSATPKGVVDLAADSARLINKIRPLINDGGILVAINNALFLSGKAYLDTLTALCADGCLKIIELIPVPPDCTGYPQTMVGAPVTDPAPFNHATKIALLEVRRKT